MSTRPQRHSSNWTNFVYASFITSLSMAGLGIWFSNASPWERGFMSMAIIMIVMMSVTMTKTLRDNADAATWDEDSRIRLNKE